jgi:hypothetical protein
MVVVGHIRSRIPQPHVVPPTQHSQLLLCKKLASDGASVSALPLVPTNGRFQYIPLPRKHCSRRRLCICLALTTAMTLCAATIAARSGLFQWSSATPMIHASTNNTASRRPHVGVGRRNKTSLSVAAIVDACRHVQSVAEIRACYPAHLVHQQQQHQQQLYSPQMTTSECRRADIANWTVVQRCLTGRFRYSSSLTSSPQRTSAPNHRSQAIREIHVVGERNSGTKFLTQALQTCFPKSTSVRVHRDFVRSKHWFQPVQPTSNAYLSSLVIVVVRHPVEWMASMVEKPYHSPNHVAGWDARTGAVQPLDWREFVARPWTVSNAQLLAPDPLRAALLSNYNTERIREPLCRHEFTVREVIPCRLDNVTAQQPPWNIPLRKWRGYEPIYEQRREGNYGDNTGSPYDHLLQLRAAKIVNWVLELPLLMRLGGFLVVRYEDVLERGNAFVMHQVASILNGDEEADTTPLSNGPSQRVAPTCSLTGPQPHRIGKRQIPPEFRAWVNQHMNVEIERLVGYSPE